MIGAEGTEEYLVRRISPLESYGDLLNFPRFFEIETVNACNARCPMCTIEDWNRKSPIMREPLFEKIADELGRHRDQVTRVSLYRDGEPLLDNKLARRVALLKQRGIRTVAISTNVSLLDEERATRLLHAGIDEVILSIDSLDPAVFESIRVRLKFDQVMENALRFIALRNRLRPSASIRVRMVRQESNRDEWPDYEKFWRPRLAPGDRCYYVNIHNWGGQLDGYRPVEASRVRALPCVALWSLMVIFANGDVPLCNVDYNNREPLGNVRDHGIAELWRSPLAAARRAQHLDGRKAEMTLCQSCTVWDEPSDAKVSVVDQFAAA